MRERVVSRTIFGIGCAVIMPPVASRAIARHCQVVEPVQLKFAFSEGLTAFCASASNNPVVRPGTVGTEVRAVNPLDADTEVTLILQIA